MRFPHDPQKTSKDCTPETTLEHHPEWQGPGSLAVNRRPRPQEFRVLAFVQLWDLDPAWLGGRDSNPDSMVQSTLRRVLHDVS